MKTVVTNISYERLISRSRGSFLSSLWPLTLLTMTFFFSTSSSHQSVPFLQAPSPFSLLLQYLWSWRFLTSAFCFCLSLYSLQVSSSKSNASSSSSLLKTLNIFNSNRSPGSSQTYLFKAIWRSPRQIKYTMHKSSFPISHRIQGQFLLLVFPFYFNDRALHPVPQATHLNVLTFSFLSLLPSNLSPSNSSPFCSFFSAVLAKCLHHFSPGLLESLPEQTIWCHSFLLWPLFYSDKLFPKK